MTTTITPPATITVDRAERAALLDAIGHKIVEVDPEANFRNRDVVSEREDRELLEHVWPLLDQLDWWDNQGAFTFEVPVDGWLVELVRWLIEQTSATVAEYGAGLERMVAGDTDAYFVGHSPAESLRSARAQLAEEREIHFGAKSLGDKLEAGRC